MKGPAHTGTALEDIKLKALEVKNIFTISQIAFIQQYR